MNNTATTKDNTMTKRLNDKHQYTKRSEECSCGGTMVFHNDRYLMCDSEIEEQEAAGLDPKPFAGGRVEAMADGYGESRYLLSESGLIRCAVLGEWFELDGRWTGQTSDERHGYTSYLAWARGCDRVAAELVAGEAR